MLIEVENIKNGNKIVKKPKRTFSLFKKLEDVLERYNISKSDISSLPNFNIGRRKIKDNDNLLIGCINEIKRILSFMVSIYTSNEASRKEFISAIIFASANYFKNIKIYPEYEIVGEEITQRVDYSVQHNNTMEEEMICITEGKQTNINIGIGQNILQLESAIQVSFSIYS